MIKSFDEQDQYNIICMIISDGSVYTRVKPILKPEYFDKKYQFAISYLNDFTNNSYIFSPCSLMASLSHFE